MFCAKFYHKNNVAKYFSNYLSALQLKCKVCLQNHNNKMSVTIGQFLESLPESNKAYHLALVSNFGFTIIISLADYIKQIEEQPVEWFESFPASVATSIEFKHMYTSLLDFLRKNDVIDNFLDFEVLLTKTWSEHETRIVAERVEMKSLCEVGEVEKSSVEVKKKSQKKKNPKAEVKSKQATRARKLNQEVVQQPTVITTPVSIEDNHSYMVKKLQEVEEKVMYLKCFVLELAANKDPDNINIYRRLMDKV